MGRNPKDDIRKPQILNHFRQVINKEGLHNASNAKVAKHMGVSANLVGHYFDSKEDMVKELLELIIKEHSDYITALINSSGTPGETLKSILKGMFCSRDNVNLLAEPSYYALYSSSLIKKPFNETFKKIYHIGREKIKEHIQLAMDAGEIKQDDPAMLTELILALFEGFSFLANLHRNGELFQSHGEYFYKKAWAILKEEDSNPTSRKNF